MMEKASESAEKFHFSPMGRVKGAESLFPSASAGAEVLLAGKMPLRVIDAAADPTAIMEISQRRQMNELFGGYLKEITRALDGSAIRRIVQCVSWLGLTCANYPFHMPANCCSAPDGGRQVGKE